MIIFLLTFVSCSGKGESSSTSSGSIPSAISGIFFATAAAAVSDLPTCDGSLEGRIYYVQSEPAFKSCSSNTWTAIDVAGPALSE